VDQCTVRLNSATGYITPKGMLAGRHQEIHVERDGTWRRRGSDGSIVANKYVHSAGNTQWQKAGRNLCQRKHWVEASGSVVEQGNIFNGGRRLQRLQERIDVGEIFV
jgi:hypothetical protein